MAGVAARSQTVTLGTLTPAAPYCPGTVITQAFTLGSPLLANTTYFIELSDASGNYGVTPIPANYIGNTLVGAGGTSGSINGTIPTGLTAGNGYKLRVTEGGLGLSTSSPSAAFQISATPALTSGTAFQLCSGATTSITLTSSVASSTFAWGAPTVSGGITGASSGSGASIAQTLTNPSNATAGTVTYGVTITGPAIDGSCTSAVQNVVVTVNPLPEITNATTTSSICSGQAANITFTSSTGAGTTFSWGAPTASAGISGAAPGNGNPLSQTLTNSSNATAGTVTYSVVPTSAAPASCPGTSKAFTVTVNPTPTVTIAPTSATFCGTGTTSFALTSSAGGTFAWAAPTTTGTLAPSGSAGTGSTIAQTLTNSSNANVATVTYNVIATAAGCPSAATPAVVTLNPIPVLTTAGTATACSGVATNINLTASATTGTNTFTYTAVNGAGITGAADGTANPIVQTLVNSSNAVSGTATYTVMPTSGVGCIGTAGNIVVTVNPTPLLTSATTATVCSGLPISIPLTASTGGGATFTYTASGTAGISGFSNGSGTPIAQTLSNSNNATAGTATYAVTPTSAAGCAGSPTNVVVTVNPKPVLTSATSASVCSGLATNIPLTASATTGTNTFAYTATNGAGVSGASNGTATPISQIFSSTSNAVAGTATYAVTPTSGAGCVGTPTNVIVTVNPTPALTTAATATVCSGIATNINLTASATTGTNTFAYTAANGANISGAANGTASPIVQTLTNSSNTTAGTATYTVTPTSGAGCVGTAGNIVVTVNPKPVLTSATTATVCSGLTTSIPLTTSTGGASTFSYTATNGSGISGGANGSNTNIAQTLTNSSNTVAGTVTYAVVPTSAVGCVGTSTNVVVTVNPAPAITTAGTASICSGGTTAIALTSSIASTFAWTAVNGANISGAGPGNALTTIAQTLTNSGNVNAGTATYTVTPTASDGTGCIGAGFPIVVTVNPKPTMTSATTATVCSGVTTNIPLTASATGTNTFAYTAVNGAGITGAIPGFTSTIAQTLINSSNVTAGTASYTVTPTSQFGCVGNSGSLLVTVNPAPTVTSGTAFSICHNQTTNITLTASTAGANTFSYVATNGAGISGAANGSVSPIAQLLTNSSNANAGTATYNVVPTSPQGCAGPATNVVVTVNPTPVLTTATSASSCSGSATNIPLNATASGTNTFAWTASNGAGTTGATNSSGSTIAQVLTNASNTTPSTATYTVTPTSQFGCAGAAVPIAVTVNPKPTLPSPWNGSACNLQTIVSDTASTGLSSNYTWTATSVPAGISGTSPGTLQPTFSQTLINSTVNPLVVVYSIIPISAAPASCAGNAFNFSLTVNPTGTTASGTYSICSGIPTNIPLSSSVSGSNFSWTVQSADPTITGAAPGTGTSLVNTLTNSSNVNPPTAVTYLVSSSTGAGCANSTGIITVNVNPSPKLTTASVKDICSGLNTRMLLTSSTGTGSTYTWTASSPSGSIIGFTSNATFSPLIDSISQTLTSSNTTFKDSVIYSVTTKSSAGCLSVGTDQIKVRVAPAPAVIAPNTVSVCSNAPTNIPLSATASSVFTWTYTASPKVSGATVSSGDTIIQTLVNTDTAASGSVAYIVIAQSKANSCFGAPHTINVTVRALPTINFPSTFYAICSGQQTSVALTPSITGSVTPWTTGNSSLGLVTGNGADSLATISQTLINGTNNTSDTVTYTVRAIDVSGGLRCAGPQKNIRVAVNPLPVMNSPTSKNICSKDRLNYAPTATTGAGARFTWTPIATTGGITGGLANASLATLINDSLVNPSNAVSGSITYAINSNSAVGCNSADPDTLAVNVAPLPVLTNASPRSLCSDSVFVFTPVSSVISGTTTFTYDRKSTSPFIVNQFPRTAATISDTLSTRFDLVPQIVDYKFLLTSAAGCKLDDQHLIVTVKPTPPPPGISIFPTTKLCSGANSMNFSAGRVPDPREYFRWSTTNAATPIQKADSTFSENALISFPNAGNAFVTVESIARGFGCVSKPTTKQMPVASAGGSQGVNVVLFANNLVAQVAGAKAYQWGFDRKLDLDSTMMNGETTQSYDTRRGFNTAANYYWVMVTFPDDCVQKAYFNGVTLSVPQQTAQAAEVRAYPNPVQDVVTLELVQANTSNLTYEVYDLTGKRLFQVMSNTAKTCIPVGEFAPGYYNVTCTQNGVRIATSRFIKN